MYSATAISRSSIGPPRALVAYQFGLEQAVERLGHGVAVGVAPAADGGDRAGLEQALGVADGEVLHAAIGVVHQRGDAAPVASAGPQAHLEGVEGQVRAQRGGGLPADDATGAASPRWCTTPIAACSTSPSAT